MPFIAAIHYTKSLRYLLHNSQCHISLFIAAKWRCIDVPGKVDRAAIRLFWSNSACAVTSQASSFYYCILHGPEQYMLLYNVIFGLTSSQRKYYNTFWPISHLQLIINWICISCVSMWFRVAVKAIVDDHRCRTVRKIDQRSSGTRHDAHKPYKVRSRPGNASLRTRATTPSISLVPSYATRITSWRQEDAAKMALLHMI